MLARTLGGCRCGVLLLLLVLLLVVVLVVVVVVFWGARVGVGGCEANHRGRKLLLTHLVNRTAGRGARRGGRLPRPGLARPRPALPSLAWLTPPALLLPW